MHLKQSYAFIINVAVNPAKKQLAFKIIIPNSECLYLNDVGQPLFLPSDFIVIINS